MTRALAILLSIALAAVGCGSEPEPDAAAATSGGPDAGAPDAPGFDAGEAPCPVGELPLDDGSCRPAGIPPGECADGFAPDDDGACSAILPAEACGDGLMAVPGETTCREVAPCGAAPWGDIPIDATTELVDGAYLGGDSDGTPAKPWATIQAAVDAAAAGAIVAVTDGSYAEDVIVDGKPVVLWGRCPRLVEIAGTGVEPAALRLLAGTDGTEVRSLALTGPARGMMVTQGAALLVDRVWFHDTGGRGLNANDIDGATEITVRGSLFESTAEVAMLISGALATVEDTVVRATRAEPPPTGRGIGIQGGIAGGLADAEVRRSVIEDNFDVGIFAADADVLVEATVVRDTKPRASDQQKGEGLAFGAGDAEATTRAEVRDSVIERNREIAVFAYGADLTLERSVVRDTRSQASDDLLGRGVGVQAAPAGARGRLVLRSSVLTRNQETGVAVLGSDATIEASVIRDNLPQEADGDSGSGIAIQYDPETGETSTASIRSCVVEDNHDLGIMIDGAEATVELTLIRNTLPLPISGEGGRGMMVGSSPDAARSKATLRFSRIEASREVGLMVSGADLLAEASTIRDTRPRASDQLSGRGIAIQPAFGSAARAAVSLRGVHVEQSHEAGITVTGSDVTLEGCSIRSTLPQASDQQLGDGLAIAMEGYQASTATLTGVTIEDSARAALSNFGSAVTLGHTTLGCSAFPMAGEDFLGSAFSFEDVGGNVCSCGQQVVTCKALSAGLAPPGGLAPGTP